MLFNSVSAFIQKHALLTPGQKLVVGVSGGPDSIALLNILNNLKDDYGISLVVAHLNHGLRPEAAHDAEFVRHTAQTWGVECVIEQVDVKALAEEKALSLEEAGRLARYTFFASLGDCVAVAHHADDQAETVLMHFLRGSGVAGLRGMLPLTIQQSQSRPPLTIIRPLLEATRAEIEAYVAEHHLEFVVDASNADQTFFRNRLRHNLLPILQTYNPNIRQILSRTAEVMAGESALLQGLVEKAWQETVLGLDETSARFDLARWRVLPIGLRRALLRQALIRLEPNLRNLDFTPLENGLDWAQTTPSGHRANLLGGFYIGVAGDELQVSAWDQAPVERPDSVLLALPGETDFLNYHFTVSTLPQVSLSAIRAQAESWTAYLNPALAPFTIRTRRAGDRFKPLGLDGTLKLSDFMVNRKLPVDQRDTWPLLCSGPNAESIVWVCGQALADSAKVSDGMQVVKVVVTPRPI